MTVDQVDICAAISRHFKLRKAVLRAEVEEYIKHNGGYNSPVIEVNLPDFIATIGLSKNTVGVKSMFFFKQFEKTELYADAVNLIENDRTDFVVFRSGKALIVIYTADEYKGLGGIFVKQDKTPVGYVIEPIEHYLRHNYPVYSEELL